MGVVELVFAEGISPQGGGIEQSELIRTVGMPGLAGKDKSEQLLD